MSPKGSNHLRLVVTSDTALFFLNGELAATLDVSKKTQPGDVAIQIRTAPDHIIVGKSTRYEGFTVLSVPEASAK